MSRDQFGFSNGLVRFSRVQFGFSNGFVRFSRVQFGFSKFSKVKQGSAGFSLG